MVSLCVSLWKPCKDTWRTKSLQTAPQETLFVTPDPVSILQTRALFPARWGLGLGLREEAHLTPAPPEGTLYLRDNLSCHYLPHREVERI